jgi:hypothetical protein
VTLKGKWQVVETPGYDMVTPGSYLLFEERESEFVLDCLTGSIYGTCEGEAVEFDWSGNDEMDEASGNGWAELQQDGSIEGEIRIHNGDDIPFIARRQTTSSTTC